MRYIKLYENWLNEENGSNVPFTLDKGLKKIQTQFDSQLIDLSSYGALSSQVRSYIDTYRNQYLNSSVWNSIGTEAGLNASLNDFKELYRLSIAGNDTNTPLNKTLSNIFKEDITDKIWYSKDTVNAAKVIKYGDDKLASSIAAGIILSQLGIAITKGLYHISGNIPLKTSDPAIKNIKNALDSLYKEDIEELSEYGGELFSITGYKRKYEYTTPGTHGRTFASDSWLEPYRVVDAEKFSPFLKNLSLDYIKTMASNASYATEAVKPMYSVLAIGEYVAERVSTGVELSVNFMKSGGPSWYQTILA